MKIEANIIVPKRDEVENLQDYWSKISPVFAHLVPRLESEFSFCGHSGNFTRRNAKDC